MYTILQNKKVQTFAVISVSVFLLWWLLKDIVNAIRGYFTAPVFAAPPNETIEPNLTSIQIQTVKGNLISEINNWFNTSDSAIIEILEPLNETDFQNLLQVFGTWAYIVNYISNSSLDLAFFPNMQLPAILREEMTDAGYNQLKAKFPSTL